jgi:hypothetical protein
MTPGGCCYAACRIAEIEAEMARTQRNKVGWSCPCIAIQQQHRLVYTLRVTHAADKRDLLLLLLLSCHRPLSTI